jgi:hypothetical protein
MSYQLSLRHFDARRSSRRSFITRDGPYAVDREHTITTWRDGTA